MRRFRRLSALTLTLCLLAALLSGCGGGESGTDGAASAKYPPGFNAAQSAAMGAFMRGGYYLMTEDYFYAAYTDALSVSQDHAVKGQSIAVLPKEERKERLYSELAGCSYLTRGDGEDVYFLDSSGGIRHTTLGSETFDPVGKAKACRTLQYLDGRLYYTRGQDSRLYSAKQDGSEEELIVDKACYYPYVFGNRVVYQDDGDGESLHLYDRKRKTDEKLLDGPVHYANIVGDAVYCMQLGQDGRGQLAGVTLGKKETEPHIYNDGDRNWYGDMCDLHYVIREESQPGKGYGCLIFRGDQSGKVQTWGALPAWLRQVEHFTIESAPECVYSSPWGCVVLDRNRRASRRYFERVIAFDGGEYSPGSRTEEETKNLLR